MYIILSPCHSWQVTNAVQTRTTTINSKAQKRWKTYRYPSKTSSRSDCTSLHTFPLTCSLFINGLRITFDLANFLFFVVVCFVVVFLLLLCPDFGSVFICHICIRCRLTSVCVWFSADTGDGEYGIFRRGSVQSFSLQLRVLHGQYRHGGLVAKASAS